MPVRSILATGERLVGAGVRSFEPVMMELIEGAVSEVQIAAYRFDPSFVGVLELLLERGVRGVETTVVTRDIAGQHRRVQAALGKLARTQRVVEFPDREHSLLHMKVLVADRREALLGSANFTMGGLVSNYELGVWLNGDEAWQISRLVDLLAAN